MNKIKRKVQRFIGVICMGICIGAVLGSGKAEAQVFPKKYKVPEKVSQLAVVRYKGSAKGEFSFYEKNAGGRWKKRFSCTAWLGSRGIGKKKEGDKKTPAGLYSFGQSFGLRKNPGTKMPYIKVNKQHYWCSDSGSKYYNQFIRKDKTGHSCRGEHLIDYKKVYDYAIEVSYNKKGKAGKGSAIFLHCKGKGATAGCIAIPRKYMKKILKIMRPEASPKILVY